MIRHHAIYYWQEIFLFNLTSDSEAILWLPPMHCLRVESENRTHGQCELFYFGLISFIHMHVQLLKVKQVYENIKDWLQNEHYKNIFLRKRFLIFLENCTQKYVKPQKRRYWNFSNLDPSASFHYMRKTKKRFLIF